MKKKLLLFLTALPLFFIGCQSEDFVVETESQPNDVVLTTEDYIDIIKNDGFDVTDIIDNGEYFIVEGDIMLDKEELKLQRESVSTRQARTKHIMSPSGRAKITLGVYDLFMFPIGKRSMHSIIQEAAQHWNSISDNLFYIDVMLLQGFDFDMRYPMPNINVHIGSSRKGPKLPDDTFGVAEAPKKNGAPGGIIQINQFFISKNKLTESQVLYNMIHEIGHIIGLRHTNWRKYESNDPATGIPGTYNLGTNPDPNSVMNGNTALNSWKGFSNFDKIAIKMLYKPMPVGTRPLYVQYNSGNNNSFYSSYIDEAFYYAQNLNYYFDDIAGQSFCVQGYVLDSPGTGRLPLYRLFRENVKNCSLTTNLSEAEKFISKYGYKWDPGKSSHIQGYVFTTQQPGTVPIYRLYSSSRNNTLLTTSYSAAVYLINNKGYVWDKGFSGTYILGYIYPY